MKNNPWALFCIQSSYCCINGKYQTYHGDITILSQFARGNFKHYKYHKKTSMICCWYEHQTWNAGPWYLKHQ